MRIVGWWCYTPYTEAKEKLDSVPIWFIEILCTHCCCPRSGVFRFNPPPLFLQPILIRLGLRRRRRQVKSRLFPSRHPNLCSPFPLRHLSQVQNHPRCNILCNRILPSPNVVLHQLKPRLLSCRLHQGVLPPSVRTPLWQPPCQCFSVLY